MIKIHRVRHIRTVFHTGVEIQQAVMGIQATKQELHAELLCTDMLDAASVILKHANLSVSLYDKSLA